MVAHGGYYYLFVSSGACCKGIGSSYQVIVGRSAADNRALRRPQRDADDRRRRNGIARERRGDDRSGLGLCLRRQHGDLIDYHYYDAWDDGDPWIQVRQLLWTSAGWPVTGPPMVPVPGAPLAPAS